LKLNMLRKLPCPSEKGFTLVELLVVIGLLGLLAAIVIPNVIRFMNSGEEETRQTELHNIQTAVTALMRAHMTPELMEYYDEVQEEDQVLLVKAKVDGEPSDDSLRDYLQGGNYPLRQAYDIATNGVVTVD